MHFDMQLNKAFDLGTRMAKAGFTEEDNPYYRLNPKLAAKWAQAFRLVVMEPNVGKLYIPSIKEE